MDIRSARIDTTTSNSIRVNPSSRVSLEGNRCFKKCRFIGKLSRGGITAETWAGSPMRLALSGDRIG
jgi:hypothetical protein